MSNTFHQYISGLHSHEQDFWRGLEDSQNCGLAVLPPRQWMEDCQQLIWPREQVADDITILVYPFSRHTLSIFLKCVCLATVPFRMLCNIQLFIHQQTKWSWRTGSQVWCKVSWNPLYYLQGASVVCCPTGPTRIPGTSTANFVALQDAITSVKQVVFSFCALYTIQLETNYVCVHDVAIYTCDICFHTEMLSS